jgi:hypothetical protein
LFISTRAMRILATGILIIITTMIIMAAVDE